MHWGRRRLSNGAANELLSAAIDPLSKQPELKHSAIRIEKADLPWRGSALTLTDAETANHLSAALQPHLAYFDYAAISLVGREATLVVLHLAHHQAPDDQHLTALQGLLGLADGALAYDDPRRGVKKRANLRDGHLQALLLFGENAAAGWLREAMLAERPAADFRRWLFAPLATAPISQASRGRILCNCLDVSENDIRAAVVAGAANMEALQKKLGCGSGCGSCLPEIGRMLSEVTV